MKNWLCLLLATACSLNAAEFTDDQKTEIETIVREYLIENPEVIVESVQVFQKREQEKMAVQVRQAIFNIKETIFTGGPVLGNKEGTVTLVEFLDYNCPHCRRMHAVVEGLVSDNPDLKVVIKELPILGQPSLLAAKAALEGEKNGNFEEIHAAFMTETERLTEERVKEIAEEAGIDPSIFVEGMDGLSDALQTNLDQAISIGVQATPAFIIAPAEVESVGDIHFISGATSQEDLQSKIDEARK